MVGWDEFHRESLFFSQGWVLKPYSLFNSGVCLVRSLSRQEFVFQEFVFPEFVFPEFVFQEFVFQEFVTGLPTKDETS